MYSRCRFKMGIVFVFAPEGRENSVDKGSTRARARQGGAPLYYNDFWARFLILAPILVPNDVFKWV